jgi:glycosyltransferase involved in cell wall biosynthesis
MLSIDKWNSKGDKMIFDKKLFFTAGDNDGCAYYRAKLPAEFLGYDYNYGFPVQDTTKLDEADIIFIQRATHEEFLNIIPSLKKAGKKVVYEVDDNLWEIPASNSAHRGFNTKVLKLMVKIIRLCDAVTVSTIPLRNYFINNLFHDNVHVIPNFIPDVFPKRTNFNAKTTIGFCGTPTHRWDFDNHLVKALRSLKEKCRLVFVGYNPIQNDADEFIKWIPSNEYHETINNLNFDITVAPLLDNEFNRCKSNIKFLEFGAMGTCFIGSKVYPYSETVKPDNGFLINYNKDWFELLDTLVENFGATLQVGENAREFVKDNFTYKYNGQFIIDKYKELLDTL